MPAQSLPPLEQLDPGAMWQPWEPSDKQPWNLKWAGHAYRRASFGANLNELRQAVSVGYKATLDKLLDPDPLEDERFVRFMELTQRGGALKDNTFKLRAWWVYSLVRTPNPLREKMTLFWHNHFATSIVKVQKTELMSRQNQLLRQHALGKFGPLLQEVSKDPAMLMWLDSNSNVKGKANENYARELMELFSLGVGNYTEKDVREGARSFTGWQVEEADFDYKYVFDEQLHDPGEKTFLREKGNFNGEDIVRICLKQDACARFLVRKLYNYFISESQQPPDALLEPLCKQFRDSDYDIGALVKTMLRSRLFFSDYAYRKRIKSPVEYALGALLAVTTRPLPEIPPGALVSKLEQMGQALFAPPNVKGWPGGKAWLTTSTVLARHNFAELVAAGTLKPNPREGQYRDNDFRAQFEEQQEAAEEAQRAAQAANAGPGVPKPQEPPAQAHLDAALLVKAEKVTEAAGVAKLLTDLLLQGETREGTLAKLAGFLQEGKPEGEEFNRRVRAAVHAVMTMPEYQLA